MKKVPSKDKLVYRSTTALPINGRISNYVSSNAMPSNVIASTFRQPLKDIRNTVDNGVEKASRKQTKSVPLGEYIRSKCEQINYGILSQDINESMRKYTLEWCIEACHKLHLSAETLFIAASLFETLVSSHAELSCENLQLAAVSAMFVAAKYQEIYPPNLNIYVELAACAYLRQDILRLEQFILRQRQFKITFPTRYECVNYIFDPTETDVRIPCMLQYLLEISLLSQWTQCTENDISEAAVYLTYMVLKKKKTFPFKVTNKVMNNAYQLISLWKDSQNSAISFIFDSQKYHFVGGTKIRF